MYMIYCYGAGVFVYILHYPEKLSKTGRFDCCGSSHNIFHLIIMLAVLTTHNENMELYARRMQFECPADPRYI